MLSDEPLMRGRPTHDAGVAPMVSVIEVGGSCALEAWEREVLFGGLIYCRTSHGCFTVRGVIESLCASTLR